jgi:hypothetical protein
MDPSFCERLPRPGRFPELDDSCDFHLKARDPIRARAFTIGGDGADPQRRDPAEDHDPHSGATE